MELIKDFENADTISIDTLALEEMLIEERTNEFTELNRLSKKVAYLHTSLLYYRHASRKGTACYEAWRILVKKVGGSAGCWWELGRHLGIGLDDLDYIKNSVKDDPTDVTLKVYMQNEKATLDNILDALTKMKRYDILKAIEEPLIDVAQCFNKDDTKSDTGYYSHSSNEHGEIISFTKNLPNDLPLALKKKRVILSSSNHGLPPANKPHINKALKPFDNDQQILFLTFAEDGHETVQNIKNVIRSWADELIVYAITLEDMSDQVLQNPEKFIREYYEKADFIVPILTSGYMETIKSYEPSTASTSDNLDSKYVNFIYNLIVNQYIHSSGCMNEKVRSVLPRNASTAVLRGVTMYPDLMPWTNEENFDEQFRVFLDKNLD